MIQIRSVKNDRVIFEANVSTVKEAVELAVRKGVPLDYANFNGMDLSEIALNGGFFTWANFSGANLSYANIIGVNMTAADFSLANLSNTNIIGSNFLSTNLILANLKNANFLKAKLMSANLTDANVHNCCFNLVDFGLAKLNARNLSKAKFHNSTNLFLADYSFINALKISKKRIFNAIFVTIVATSIILNAITMAS